MDSDPTLLAQSGTFGPFARSTQLFDTKAEKVKAAPAQPLAPNGPRTVHPGVVRSTGPDEAVRTPGRPSPPAPSSGTKPTDDPKELDVKRRAETADHPAAAVQAPPSAHAAPPVLTPPIADARPSPLPPQLEAYASQLADDPSARVAISGSKARMSVDTGEPGRLSVELRVNEGVTDIRATGPAAQMLDTRQNELRVALAHEGLALGRFDLSHRDQRPEHPEPQAEGPRTMPRPQADRPALSTVSADGGIHVRA